MNGWRWAKIATISLAIIAGGIFLWWQMDQDGSQLRLDGHSYHITVMRTDEQRAKGLSGTKSLPPDQAMVFVFPYDNRWGMWMKDMHYSIDMVWLNSEGEVVYLARNAQPSSYPKTTFTPDTEARYVIELPSGTIDKTGIQKGDPAGLPEGV